MPINPFDPFGSSNPVGKHDEIFARPVRGIGRPARPKADPAAADSLDPDPEAADSRNDPAEDPAPPPKPSVQLANPRWSKGQGTFNKEIGASVEAELPAEISHLTKVTFTAYALVPGENPERIDSKTGHIRNGKAEVNLTLWTPGAKDADGNPPKECRYVFRAAHRDSGEIESEELPVGTGPTPIIKSVEITSVPPNFVPTAEKCKIKYKVEADAVAATDKGTLVILDKDGKEIYKKTDLPLDETKELTFEWDGKDAHGKMVALDAGAMKVKLSVTGDAKVAPKEKEVKVEIHSLSLEIRGMDDRSRVFMNDPAAAFDIVAAVKMKKSDGSAMPAESSLKVKFTFTRGANTAKAASYQYDPAPKRLGKDAAGTVYWKKHADCEASSADSFHTACVVKTLAGGGADQGKAKVQFLPSGVGKDKFKVKASVLAADNVTVLKEIESVEFTVWRSVDFSRIYEMHGENHVATHATTAGISPYFDPAFVKFTAGAANAIPAGKSVEYIGLWKDNVTKQESWSAISAKTAAERPSPTELADAGYAGAAPNLVARRDHARAAIKAKAQAWTNRIDAKFDAAMDKWLADAAIPHNSIIGIRYYHPKYNITGDTATSEWNLYGAGTPAWLRVDTFSGNYTDMDPDDCWVFGGEWGGLSIGNGIFSVPKNATDVIVKVVCHEAAHATRSFFKREDFGPSLDHSVSNAGIMYFDTTGGDNFTEREKKVLRGVVP